MVVGATIRLLQSRANREVTMPVVNIADRICVRARVQDRHVRKPSATGIDQATGIQGAQRDRIADGALGNEAAIDVIAADALVEIEELIDGDRAAVQARKTILNADIVLRTTREAGFRIATVDVRAHLLNRAARSLR